MNEVELVFSAHDEVGEGPLWSSEEGALYWVDNESSRYHRLDIATGEHTLVSVPEKVGVLVFRQRGGFVWGSDRGFSFYDPSSGVVTPIGDPEAGKPGTQINDGKVDRAGRFWAGTLGDSYNNSLYRLDADGTIHPMDTGFDISNGLGWSPDNRVMYFTDSTPGIIYAYDFDLAAGAIANRRVFVDRAGRPGVPDGLTVDAEGYIWSAVWGGGCVECYDPAGRLARTLALPINCPASVAFGGPALQDLYITTALYEVPQAARASTTLDGSLFCVRGLAQGLAEPSFAG